MTWFADTASWALIAGVLTPLLVSVVQQPRWSQRVRAVVAAVAAVAVGVVTVLANGGFRDASGALGVIALVLVSSNTAYKTLWKPAGVSPSIEVATSPGSSTTAYAGARRNDMGQANQAVTLAIGVLVIVVLVLLVLRLA